MGQLCSASRLQGRDGLASTERASTGWLLGRVQTPRCNCTASNALPDEAAAEGFATAVVCKSLNVFFTLDMLPPCQRNRLAGDGGCGIPPLYPPPTPPARGESHGC